MPDRTLPEHLQALALAGIATLSALLATTASADERVVDGHVAADVIGVVPLRSAGRGLPWRARVTVRLDDGLRVRLTYRRPFPRVGERVQLQLVNGELQAVRPSH